MPSIPAGLRYCDWLWSTGAPGRNLAPNLRERTFHRGAGELGVVILVFQLSCLCGVLILKAGHVFFYPEWNQSWVILSCLQLSTSQLPEFLSALDSSRIFHGCGLPPHSSTWKVLAHPDQRTFLDIAQMCQPEGPEEFELEKMGTCTALPIFSVQFSRHEQ